MRQPTLLLSLTALLSLLTGTLLILGYLALTGGTAEDRPLAGTEPGPGVQAWARDQIVDTLPAFTMEDLSGRERAIGEWVGQPMIINVWATWCGPCREEVPLLIDIQAEHGDQLTVIGLSMDDPAPVSAFAREFGINYPLLVGDADARTVTRLLGSDELGLPHTFVVDAEGRIVGFHLGLIRPEEVPALLTPIVDMQ
ncbi:TlpA family protein disulfide reductase [Natronospirillum operosum]|uniref:TlpA family protein disulfide reductase n=1 Tax=Natronospirillum operosum TaxID=2759953 RepID=A0A4Z0WJ87_9GAMM|nr:TlpA disulfide reductase family protein [Natronospirillum operosum]TGG95563.1 TlpA family protein disulfide reductase [Natronospirillum operosum]